MSWLARVLAEARDTGQQLMTRIARLRQHPGKTGAQRLDVRLHPGTGAPFRP
jgi:hypothetical protein